MKGGSPFNVVNTPLAERPISEEFRLVAKKWVDADAAANMLEESKSAFLAELMTKYADEPVSRAEMRVKSSPEWREYLKNMVERRQEANRLKLQCEYLRMKFSEWQSRDANARHEYRLGRGS